MNSKIYDYIADWGEYSLQEQTDNNFASVQELAAKFGMVACRKDLHRGGAPIWAGNGKAIFQTDDSMSIVFGGSGSKKTRTIIAPTIVSLAYAGENMLISDIKGELSDPSSDPGRLVCGALEANGYKIVRLNFRSADQDGFNLMEQAYALWQEGDILGARNSLFELVDTIAQLSTSAHQDPFWVQSARSLLMGICFLMLFTVETPKEMNLYTLSMYLNEFGLDSLENVYRCLPDEARNSPLMVLLKSVLEEPEKTKASTITTASNMLSFVTSNEALLRMMSLSTFSAADLCRADKKTALFLILPDETNACDALGGVVAQQLISLAMKCAAQNGGRLAKPLNCVMDEFCNLKISGMDRYISAHRSRNIRWFLACQSLQQLRSVYPAQADTILSNCANWFFLSSNERELLELFSFRTGQTHLSASGRAEPLLTTQQLLQLRKGDSYTETLYINGRTVCVNQLPDISLYRVPAASAALIRRLCSSPFPCPLSLPPEDMQYRMEAMEMAAKDSIAMPDDPDKRKLLQTLARNYRSLAKCCSST